MARRARETENTVPNASELHRRGNTFARDLRGALLVTFRPLAKAVVVVHGVNEVRVIHHTLAEFRHRLEVLVACPIAVRQDSEHGVSCMRRGH
jgi:hypothetical protein